MKTKILILLNSYSLKTLAFIFSFVFFAWSVDTSFGKVPELSEADAQRIGQLIWNNECGGTVEGLTMWNKGEEFPSIGIGHFIWYPTGTTGKFQESFPSMVAYLREKGVEWPDWVLEADGCPWPTREAFQSDLQGPRLSGLRDILKETVSLQARYAALRFRGSLPKILEYIDSKDRPEIERKFNLIASHPKGLYALMDYVNFKGEGTNPKERYHGYGWGMLQALQEMKPADTGKEAVNHFADAAIYVLNRRIKHSPPERNEARWRPGWTNRCNTYRP